jgi:hypothetical protein
MTSVQSARVDQCDYPAQDRNRRDERDGNAKVAERPGKGLLLCHVAQLPERRNASNWDKSGND